MAVPSIGIASAEKTTMEGTNANRDTTGKIPKWGYDKHALDKDSIRSTLTAESVSDTHSVAEGEGEHTSISNPSAHTSENKSANETDANTSETKTMVEEAPTIAAETVPDNSEESHLADDEAPIAKMKAATGIGPDVMGNKADDIATKGEPAKSDNGATEDHPPAAKGDTAVIEAGSDSTEGNGEAVKGNRKSLKGKGAKEDKITLIAGSGSRNEMSAEIKAIRQQAIARKPVAGPAKAHFADLPTEILEKIASYVGTDGFSRDVDRLTLCRSWYEVAIVVFQKEVFIGDGFINRLRPAGNSISRRFRSRKKTEIEPTWMTDNTKSISIASHDRHRLKDQSLGRMDRLVNRLTRRSKKEDSSEYDELLMGLKNATKKADPSFELLYTLCTAPSQTLTTLKIDLNTGGWNELSKRHGSHEMEHICNVINGVMFRLNQLKEIQLRMKIICTNIFSIRRRDAEYPLALETFVVSISLCEGGAPLYDGWPKCAYDCKQKGQQSCDPAEFWNRINDMKQSAKVFVKVMPNPKMMRIMWPRFQSNWGFLAQQTIAWDVVTDQTRQLTPLDAWTDEGVQTP